MQGSLFSTKRKKQCRLYSLLVFLCSCSTPQWIMELNRSDAIKKELVFGREHRDSLLFFIQKVFDDFSEVNKKSVKKYSPEVSKYLNNLVRKDELKKRLTLIFLSFLEIKRGVLFYFTER